MQKIRRDDEIIVIAGKDKGKRGKVLKVLADDRLVVGGVNLVKRHTKPNPMAGVPGRDRWRGNQQHCAAPAERTVRRRRLSDRQNQRHRH